MYYAFRRHSKRRIPISQPSPPRFRLLPFKRVLYVELTLT